MKTLELLQSYPLATEVIKKWFLKELLLSCEDESVPEEFRKMMVDEGITDEKLCTLINAQPRILFDVFDDNGFFIGTHVAQKNSFHYTINNDRVPGGAVFTRKQAESLAITEVFKLLEIQLTPKDVNEINVTTEEND